MAMHLSRRSLLAGGVAVTVIAATGGALLVSGSDKAALVRSVLARLVGPFSMADAEFGKMVAAVDARKLFPQGYKLAALSSLERSGWSDEAMRHAPAAIRDDAAKLERAILTEFVTRTTYMGVADKARDPILYLGPQPCSSPFARFEMT
ncbi:hypothetical protein [Sphingomonas sp. SRS2]|uniref:hypothetical protein n=1 Tax=Sphingomonas sp. SRS2 TaxID=133190 RepID=UPI0006184A00|nr:hypothetical protein [Sphingomonas sp. SRS2]KKC26208.1 hypothetical protein WP12_10010 [Sphingomonas sp. SRS2]